MSAFNLAIISVDQIAYAFASASAYERVYALASIRDTVSAHMNAIAVANTRTHAIISAIALARVHVDKHIIDTLDSVHDHAVIDACIDKLDYSNAQIDTACAFARPRAYAIDIPLELSDAYAIDATIFPDAYTFATIFMNADALATTLTSILAHNESLAITLVNLQSTM